MHDSVIGPDLLVVRQLTKVYGDVVAVDHLDLTVHAGEVFGLLGPNGAGKTTTITVCTGLLRPTSGSVEIDGVNMESDPRTAKRLIGYVPDEPDLYDKLSAREFIRLMGELYGVTKNLRQRTEELLAYFDLLEVGDDLIGGYSHGMRQKTALSGMLIHEPRLLFLDEPTVGLDPKSARLLKDSLQSLAVQGRAVILCTHILEIAEAICDRVGILNRGKIVAEGSLEQLRATVDAESDESLEDIFLRLTGGEDDTTVARAMMTP